MAKVSPLIPSFNGGEFSPLMAGRVDIDRYKASMQRLWNFIAVPQGPVVGRSGTQFVTPVYDETKRSGMVPFTFNEDQSFMLEFAHQRLRFHSDAGILTQAPVDVSAISNSSGFLRFTSATLGASFGDEVVLSGFPASAGLAGLPVKINNVVGTAFTTNYPWPGGAFVPGMQVARVYHVVTPYTETAVRSLRAVQSGNDIYLFSDGLRMHKLSRYGAYDWRIAPVALIDGPFAPVNKSGTRLTPEGTGGFTVAPAVSNLGNQTATLVYDFVTPRTVNGYTIYLPRTLNTDVTYSLLDQSPSTWTLEGNNDGGVVWDLLDEQVNYVLFDNYKSVFFEVKNNVAYRYYKINVVSARRNGPLQPAVAYPGFNSVIFSTAETQTFNLTASSLAGINQDRGFLTTDIGRLLRYKSSDGNWVTLEIIDWNSPSQVKVKPQGGPLSNTRGTADWRLGLFSDTSGWPTCGVFFEDRLWVAGAREFPDFVCGSMTGNYERFSQTTEAGVVTDDNAVIAPLNSRKLSQVVWLATDERGLLVGTKSSEWAITAGERDGAITARSVKARQSTKRGSAAIEPVQVDRQVLYVQRSQRTVREFAYVFEADGYKSPSMSLFASHLGVPKFEESDYASEPHSIVWYRRGDGTVAGLTYNREENVVGWHVQDFAGGFVEALGVIPSSDGLQDTLWLSVRRVVNGQTRRYIEKLTRFWDFDMELSDAHYVDCGLRYQGVPQSVFYIPHLRGQTIVGLSDGRILPEMVVGLDGKVELSEPGSNVLLGLPFDAIGRTSRLEAGAQDGTAQGKTKRIHKAHARVWRTGSGSLIGRSEDALEEIALRDGTELVQPLVDRDCPIDWPEGYDKDAVIVFKRPGNVPLPFNLIAVMPQLMTQDA